MKLLYHTPEEWAVVTANRLRMLGCSDEYIAAERARILAEAEPVDADWQSGKKVQTEEIPPNDAAIKSATLRAWREES